jgi:MFS family permease
MESIEVTASEPAGKDALDSITKAEAVAEAVAEMAATSNEKDIGEIAPISEGKTTYSKLSVTLMVVFSGLAIGSDGFNASIIGNLSLIFGVLYPDLSTTMYSRLSNAFIIGMIVGMLAFGYISDRLGRKSGAVFTTLILVVGIALSAASSGKDEFGMFWMLVISRGIAGVGAGG